MPIRSPATKSSSRPNIAFKFANGAAAGNVTVTGIGANDEIISVIAVGLTEGTPNTFTGIADLTSEFTISAANQINNTGGTSTSGKLLLVTYWPRPAQLG